MSISDINRQPAPGGMSDGTHHSTGGTFFDKALNLHIKGIRNSLSYLPDQRHRRYYEWILEQEKIKERWLQLVSVTKTILLTEALLKGVLNQEELDYVLPYSVIINTYLMYEVVSDNLAIGLASRQPHDQTFEERRQVLKVFNRGISGLIRGTSDEHATDILTAYKSLIQRISSFDQSLNPLQHTQIAAAFLESNPHAFHPDDLEFGLYSSLVANIETCATFVEALREFEAFSMLQNGLARRYEGVSKLFQDTTLSNEELVQIGSDTMLVVPVVGYYAAIIGEVLRPTKGYQVVLRDGILQQALEEASLLVRLLNDLGTKVLNQTHHDRKKLVELLRENRTRHETFESLVRAIAENEGAALARLRKDLSFGEFNVGFYAALRANSVNESLDLFETQLAYLDQVYQNTRQSLKHNLGEISKHTGGPAIAEIIARFVRFHEDVYGQSYEDGTGEYAI